MPRIEPIRPGESPDAEVNEILEEARTGFWADASLMGLVAHQPHLLKAIVPVFRALFSEGSSPPDLKDIMRVLTGYEWGCAY
jgi:hypothetical protein